MNKQLRLIPALAAAAALTLFAGAACAEVGKKISVVSTATASVAQYPAFTDAMTVAVPAGYKSKANFLKVTTTYQASCSGSDYMGSRVNVGGFDMVDGGIPFESHDEDAPSQFISKTYYLVPENQSGPAIPPDSTVTLELTSEFGTGCSISNGTMTVESAK